MSTETRERPILFSGPMVRAILSGRKTQTRRIIKQLRLQSPYGVPGDRLWVRENGWEPPEVTPRRLREGADTWPEYAYDADGIAAVDADLFREWGWKRRPSIHMPRWASRITLEVKSVRVERLQDISEEDAKAEGIKGYQNDDGTSRYVQPFRELWNEINGKRGFTWNSNPWVWVVEFAPS